MAIGTLAVNIVARTEKFEKNMRRAGALTSRFAKTAKRLAPIIGGITTAFGAAGLTAGVSAAASRIDDLAKTADKLGIATEKLSGLQLAAVETGAGVNVLNTGLQRMVRRISEAAAGTGEAQAALAELGLNAQRLNSLSPDQQFGRIARAMGDVANQADKVRLASKLFDTEGVALVNTLALGEEGFARMTENAIKFGNAVSGSDAKAVEEMNSAIARMRFAVDGLFNKLTVQLSPAIEAAAERMTEWLTSAAGKAADVGGSFGGFAGVLGGVADAVNIVHIGFKALSAGITSAIAVAVSGLDRLQHTIVDVANMIPGVTLETSTFITSLSETMAHTAAEQWADVQKAWLAPPPSAAVERMFRPIEEKMDEIEKRTPKLSEGTMEAAQKIGQLFGQASNGLNGALNQAAAMVAKAFGPQAAVAGVSSPERTLTLAKSGTADSFRQRRRIERQGGGMPKMEGIANKQLKELKEIKELAKRGGEPMMPANIRG